MKGKFKLPLLPVFLTYTAGLYVGHFRLPLPLHGWVFLLSLLLGLWLLLVFIKRNPWSSLVSLGLFFVVGILSLQSYLQPVHPPSHLSQFLGPDRVAIEGVVDRPPHMSEGNTQLPIRCRTVALTNHSTPVKGRLLLFVRGQVGSFRLGDRLRFLARIHAPRGFRNPGGFSYERYLAFQGIDAVAFLSGEHDVVKTGDGFANPLLLWIEVGRGHLRHFLENETGTPVSSVLKALVLGEQGSIPAEVKEAFVATGTAHLLAISGDHLGIVALLSFSLFLWCLKRSEFLLLSLSVKKWAAAMTIPCILLYTFVAGAGISVIRATMMVVTFFLSILFDRDRNLLYTLALAAFLILLFSPPSLYDVSFQLSFLAVLSILYLVPPILQGWKTKPSLIVLPETSWGQKVWHYAKVSLLVTAVATVGTAPFVALHFNRVSPLGLVTNLFVVPWVGFVIVPGALVACLLSFVCYPAAALLIQGIGFLTRLLLGAVTGISTLPYASLTVSTPTALEIALFYLLLFLVPHLAKSRRARTLALGLSLALLAHFAYWQVRDHFQRDLRLTFLDVGHGDSILVEFPGGKKMLIDGGGSYDDRFDPGKHVIAPFLWKRKIQHIEYLVLTHPDPDHLKGLSFIVSHFSVGEFWTSSVRPDGELYAQLEQLVLKNRVPKVSLSDRSPSLRVHGVDLSILHPPPSGESTRAYSREGRRSSRTNNFSLVLRLQYGRTAFLLPGDIEEEAEQRIVSQGYPLKADLLKVPHHGSRSSSTPLLLEKVSPTFAILSVGPRNLGRLPHPEVLRRYEQMGSRLFRTDRDGAVTVTTDGETLRVIPYVRAENGN
jgi:competence protein ComEC